MEAKLTEQLVQLRLLDEGGSGADVEQDVREALRLVRSRRFNSGLGRSLPTGGDLSAVSVGFGQEDYYECHSQSMHGSDAGEPVSGLGPGSMLVTLVLWCSAFSADLHLAGMCVLPQGLPDDDHYCALNSAP
jgi:hypothetical protein